MTVRVLFLGEGPSDAPLTGHIERILLDAGVDALVSPPDPARLPKNPGRKVADKLQAIVDLARKDLAVGTESPYDLVAVHRDADRSGYEARYKEIRSAVRRVLPDIAHVCVVPVRMTEAWLLLDEPLLRRVAGNPNGRVPLGLPSPREVERIADPKTRLREVLVTASGSSGRRQDTFQKRFSQNRRILLERLDPDGPVRQLPSWQRFVDDVHAAIAKLGLPMNGRTTGERHR